MRINYCFFRFIIFTVFLSLWLSIGIGDKSSAMENKFIQDFYPIQREVLEQSWYLVAGPNSSNLEYIRDAAKKFNMNPIDLATILVADVASRIAWPGGIPVEVPYGFVFSPSGMSQIPPGMAISNRLLRADLITPGARNRFNYMSSTILQPEKGVDYWFVALSEEAFNWMNDPAVNVGVSARYVRRVADTALDLFMPDAHRSIMLSEEEKKLLLPDQTDYRWLDEFDWGRLRNYMRNHLLWDRDYEIDLTEFIPSDKRWSELNLMIIYSEYRTSPPFDGSWFFEAMNVAKETRRWIETQDNIKEHLQPLDGKPELYKENVEDYSFYQNEGQLLNPQHVEVDIREVEESEINKEEDSKDDDKKEDDSKDDKKKPSRKPRGKY